MEVAVDVRGAADRIARAEPQARDPAAELEGREQGRRLGVADTGVTAELGEGGARQPAQPAVAAEQPLGDLPRRVPRAARAEQQRDQLGVREGLGAEAGEALAGRVRSRGRAGRGGAAGQGRSPPGPAE